MKSTRWVLIAGIMLSTTLFAQGLRQQGQDTQQIWLKFEKELGLQTRYAVDMEIEAMGMTMPSKMFRTEGKTRSEMTLPFMNMHMVALERPENGKTVRYSLFPDKKKYCLMPEEEKAKGEKKPTFKLEELGTEAYEGETCKKRRMTVKISDDDEQVMDMLFSPTQKNMPVKMTATATIKTEASQPPTTITSVVLFKNYRFGPQDASLFTIPKDYTKAKDMQEIMMSGLFGGGAGQPPAGGMTLPPEALEALQKAQTQGAPKDAAGESGADAEAMRQNLQNLRRLLGK